ncbi:MAG: type IV pilus assembly protein PilM [Candidatus Omnitrophica bacterium]|nr:type IV pilus assembly protein PilM [Candidatus Omnitrophota bacterium]
MFKASEKQYFGLDIGESSIKFVRVVKTRDGFRFGTARVIELETDTGYDSSEKRDEIIKEHLANLMKEENITDGVAAISISGQSVFIRPLKVPKIAKNKIEQIIHYEAQLQVPFPINEVIWNYELFEAYDSPEIEVALVAVKKDIIQNKLDILSELGIDVDFVEVDPFSLYNVMEFLDSVKNKIVLDMGAKVTNIIIVQEKRVWTRSVLMGGNDLTRSISTLLKMSFREAEELKRKEGIIVLTEADKTSSPHAQAISDAISPILVELLADISKSIGYFKSQSGGATVFREILVTGGVSKLRNLAQFIRENIDIPTRQFNILEKIKDEVDFEPTDELAGRIDVACGLALRNVSPLATKINLLPKDILRTKEFEKKKWYIFGSLISIIMIFVTMTAYLEWSSADKSGTLERTTRLISQYNKYQKEITDIQKDIQDLSARLDYVSGIPEMRTRTISSVAELIGLLPEKAWFTRLTQEEDDILLEGEVEGTFQVISEYRTSLLESGYFAGVEIVSADELKTEDTAESLRTFVIRLTMRKTGGDTAK